MAMAHKETVHPAFSDLMDSIGKPRHVRQDEIEKALVRFRPDPIEAQELLPCLLMRMIDDDEIQHYALYLRKALERYAQKRDEDDDDADDAYDSWRARQE